MTDFEQVVAIDVGNSSIKLATNDRGTLLQHSISHQSENWEQEVLDWVDGLSRPDSIHWRIASVRPSAANHLVQTIGKRAIGKRAIGKRVAEPSIEFITHHRIPMPITVDHPDRLGIDRLLSAYAASRRFGLPAVVIDAGSAVTVDWVGETGSFAGGAIFPGLALQARSLANGTEALHEIRWNQESLVAVPAKNTSDAMLAGILLGVSAAIDALIDRYCQTARLDPDNIRVVMTGGDGPTLSPHLRHNHQVFPNLVCRGLLDLPRSEANATTADSA